MNDDWSASLAGRDRPVQRADDAGRDRALQAERRADRDHRVADDDVARTRPSRSSGRPVRATLTTARSYDASLPTIVALAAPAVGEDHADRAAAGGGRDDVVVGHDVAVRAEDEAGPGVGLLAAGDLERDDAGQHPAYDAGDRARRPGGRCRSAPASSETDRSRRRPRGSATRPRRGRRAGRPPGRRPRPGRRRPVTARSRPRPGCDSGCDSGAGSQVVAPVRSVPARAAPRSPGNPAPLLHRPPAASEPPSPDVRESGVALTGRSRPAAGCG